MGVTIYRYQSFLNQFLAKKVWVNTLINVMKKMSKPQ